MCACDEEKPWTATGCQERSRRTRLCACAKGIENEASEIAARTATFGETRERIIADGYVRRALNAAADPDCSTSTAELDGLLIKGDLLALTKAVRRLRHCGVLVVRNALSKSFMQSFRRPFHEYVQGLTNGTISIDGRTSLNEPYFLHKLDEKRWEILLPQSFAVHQLINLGGLSSILSHFSILGRDRVLHSLGAALSEAGSSMLHWHRDSLYPHRGSSAAGTDMPPHAVTMLTPLLDITDEHGPTEFCVGTAHLFGLDKGSGRLQDAELAPLLDDNACPEGLAIFRPKLKVSRDASSARRSFSQRPFHTRKDPCVAHRWAISSCLTTNSCTAPGRIGRLKCVRCST